MFRNWIYVVSDTSHKEEESRRKAAEEKVSKLETEVQELRERVHNVATIGVN